MPDPFTMPIFTGLEPRLSEGTSTGSLSQATEHIPPPLEHRSSEESIRTEFCEGPLPDDYVAGHDREEGTGVRHDPMTIDSPTTVTSDRAELIERLKRGESLQWAPKTQLSDQPVSKGDSHFQDGLRQHRPEMSLLPALELKGPIGCNQKAAMIDDLASSNLNIGLAIQRPRSALHSGNFSEELESSSNDSQAIQSRSTVQDPLRLGIHSPPKPLDTNGRGSSNNFSRPLPRLITTNHTSDVSEDSAIRFKRPRAPSLHSHPSLSFRSPTSPLVQQSSQDDGDDQISSLKNSSKDFRRRTLPTEILHSLRSLPSSLAQAARQPSSSFQHDNYSFSTLSRDARRSATFGSPYLAAGSPPTPNFLRSRRSSCSSEAPSPLQPSSMVGSYEESILRGRMSSMPSRPVDFTAQIGALGKDDCKPKHPSHAILTFPAVFYNWSSVDMPSSAEPSPYVGQIDLEHGLPPPQKKQRIHQNSDAMEVDTMGQASSAQGTGTNRSHHRRRRRSPSPNRLPLGGCYRIPQRGQLQILIKNPNKTAVKLFLIPYELDDMLAGTKTFIRQNCYSAGPIIENPVTSKPRAESAMDRKSMLADPRNKPRLRYSVHLHICCPTKGRFYLYKEIKVVFANRVPDNEERLRTEIRLPEPRYSPWRPIGDAHASPSPAEARRSFDYQHRRRSSQNFPNNGSAPFDAQREAPMVKASNSMTPPVPTLPAFDKLGARSAEMMSTDNRRVVAGMSDASGHFSPRSHVQSPLSDRVPNVSASFSASVRSSSSNDSVGSSYSKLNKGDLGYGGLFARPGTPDASESLLSRRLRGLEEDQCK